jgi:MerR family transcriptional regulator, repressor of the yfmOP operon
MRIGELAERAGTTPRTVRYYEEIGLLPGAADRSSGGHRSYGDADLERLRELLRLRDLLGLTLEELKAVVAAEDARAEIRREYRSTESPARRAELLQAALGHLDTQLGLVRHRMDELATLEAELRERQERVRARLAELGAPVG